MDAAAAFLDALEGFDDNLDDVAIDFGSPRGNGDDGDAADGGPGAAPAAVVARIENLVGAYVESVARGQLPTLSLVSRMMEGGGSKRSTFPPPQPLHPCLGTLPTPTQRRVQGPPAGAPQDAPPQTLSLTSRGGASALRHARALLVLAAAHEALTAGRTITLRDLYYSLKAEGAMSHQAAVTTAVVDATRLVGVPRDALALRAAPRGAVAGPLVVDDGGGVADLARVGPAGRVLPGSAATARALARSAITTASHLVIVEKDAVFERLVEDAVWARVAGGCFGHGARRARPRHPRVCRRPGRVLPHHHHRHRPRGLEPCGRRHSGGVPHGRLPCGRPPARCARVGTHPPHLRLAGRARDLAD